MEIRKFFSDIWSFLESLESRKTLLLGLTSVTAMMIILSFVAYGISEADSVVGYVLASSLCSLGLNFFGMLSIVTVSYHLIYVFFLTNILIGGILDFFVMLSFGWFAFVWLNQIFNLIMCYIHLRHIANDNFHKNSNSFDDL